MNTYNTVNLGSFNKTFLLLGLGTHISHFRTIIVYVVISTNTCYQVRTA